MIWLILEPIAILAFLCAWTWGLCAVLSREEPYGWLVAILFVPPVGLPLYILNRASGGAIDRHFERVRFRHRVIELEGFVASDSTFDRRLELATLLVMLGRHRDALAHLKVAMEQDDEDRRVQYLAGVCLLKIGRPEMALPHLEFVAEKDPGFDGGAAVIAATDVLLEAGRKDEALALLERATLRLNMPTIALRKARVLGELGRREAAIAIVEQLLDSKEFASPRKRRALKEAANLLSRLKGP